MSTIGTTTPNDSNKRSVSATQVSDKDLPLHCPTSSMSLWNSHPRVFLPIKEAVDGKIICPYCGTKYIYNN